MQEPNNKLAKVSGSPEAPVDAAQARDGTPGVRAEGEDRAGTAVAARQFIEALAERKVKGFCGTIDDEGNYYSEVYAGNVSLAESITADYHSRFLIELIQNAYDVHPLDRADGEIEVLLDQEAGNNGILYVANKGGGFSKKNVNALCDMGLSSKPPGESIGNKGLGFRSVLHITDAPLIFSQASAICEKPRFDGFCFGFADSDDLDRLITNPLHRACAARDLPLFHVPSWHDQQSQTVTSFAKRGFASVIALPLRDADARQATLKELRSLRTQSVPLLLFLPRLAKLSVTVMPEQRETIDDSFSLFRSEKELTGHKDSTIVDLRAVGRFLIVRKPIPEAKMKEAIADGIAKKQLHSHWNNWEGSGEVALAVRLDGGAVVPRLYTFLPMGEQATAPIRGYMHGTFFPTSNRKGLDANIKLNALLIEEGVSLGADTVVWLARGAIDGIDNVQAASAAVDFLNWDDVTSLEAERELDLASSIASRVASVSGAAAFDDAAVIPCLGDESSYADVVWRAPAQARRWQFDLPSFSAQVAAVHGSVAGFAPLWPDLGDRLDPLARFLSTQAPAFVGAPTAIEKAELAVSVAAALAATKRVPDARWAEFYRDLVELMGEEPSALEGRQILLCTDGKLRKTMAQPTTQSRRGPRRRRRKGDPQAFVFSPPARTAEAAESARDLIAPAELKDEFAFLSDKLDWYGELSSARSFLENAKLVSAFDRDTVLSQLSMLLRHDGRKGARAAGLRWAFQVWRRPREGGRPFKLQPQHRFFVPTEEGRFIEASDAVFSEKWPRDTLGELLQRFLDSAPPDAPDLTELRRRKIAAPTHYAFNRGTRDQWVEFLTELGVQHGLHPVPKKVATPVSAADLSNFHFCADIGIGPEAAAFWKQDIAANERGALALPSTTEYIVRGDLWWLPGQGAYERFTEPCRESYACLIVAWFTRARSINWSMKVHHRHFHTSDTRDWPTPFASFLRSAAWLPADEPTADGARRVSVNASEIWLPPEASPDRFLHFLRRPVPVVARLLERMDSDHIGSLRRRSGLHVLNDPGTLLKQADFLAEQYDRAGFDRYFERHFINLYHRTWHLIGETLGQDESDLSGLNPPARLIVRRGDTTSVIKMRDDEAATDQPVYVRDCEDETAASLIESSEKPYFDPREANPARIGKILKAFYGDAIRLLSEAECSAKADGQALGSGDVAPLVARCPWLKPLTAVAMEALRGTELQRLPADRSIVIARLERAVLQRADTLAFKLDDQEITQAIGTRRAFAFRYGEGSPLIVVRAPGSLTWDGIDACLCALCEAIEQPSLEPYLRILILKLKRDAVDVSDMPPADLDLVDLCAALQLKEAAIGAVRDTLGTRLDRHLPWLRTLAHMAGGDEALDDFKSVEADLIKEPDQLRAWLAPVLGKIGLDADLVLDACKRSLTVRELRDRLSLAFEALNMSLIAAGESPDTYPELHSTLMANYIHENEVEIIDALRTVFAPRLRLYEQAPTYRRLREDTRTIAPAPEWLLRYHHLPRPLMASQVDIWLESHGASREMTQTGLLPLDAVRQGNREQIRKFANSAAPLIRAWCMKRHQPLPGLFNGPIEWADKLRSALDEAGVYDCLPLDAASLVKWCGIIGAWPTEMPQTLDRDALGLAESDLDDEKAREREAAEARKREARSVPFNGRGVDPETAEWDSIAAELAGDLSQELLSTPLGAQPDLLPRRPGSPRDRQKKPGKKGPPAGRRAPSEKTDMIGRLGELVVYNWLKTRLPKQNIDAAWVSENGEPFTGREGDDALGYDFAVTFRNQLWQIEVKASLGDPCMFEMGESEVRAAREAARPRSGSRYAIAYVSNVGEPRQARVELLPNPMSDEGEAAIYLLGEGIRYGFRRS